MQTLEEIKQIYPEIPIGHSKNLVGNIYGKGIKPLYRTYNDGQNVTYVCTAPCGHYFTYCSTELTRTRGLESRGCPICYKEKNDLTGKRFGKLVVLYPLDKRSNNHVVWHCKCDCGNECDVNSSSLRIGQTQSCGCWRSETHIKNLVGQRFGKLTVLYDTGERQARHVIWHCKCDCGNECNVNSRELLNGDTQSCGCIRFKSSHGELKITQLLKENNISFESQYKIKTGESYKYIDFMIFNNEIPQYAIEYDGKQHFQENAGWGEPLEEIQRRDNEKNQWCKENNIPLIRIPYTEYDNLNIEMLQLQDNPFLVY